MSSDNLSVKSNPRCRICLSDECVNLITPCNCSGTIGLVHAGCLERWASVSCRVRCEICKCKYQGRRVPKYGVLASALPFAFAKWRWSRALVFLQAILLFAIVNSEIGTYFFGVDDPDFPKASSLFSVWCLLTFNFLVYFIGYSVATVVDSWNAWRRSQFVFVLNRH